MAVSAALAGVMVTGEKATCPTMMAGEEASVGVSVSTATRERVRLLAARRAVMILASRGEGKAEVVRVWI